MAGKEGPDEERVTAVLRRARQLLERGWCQGTLAQDAEGLATAPDGPDARAFCMGGAIIRAVREMPIPWDYSLERAALDRVRRATGRSGPFARYNDLPGRRQTTILKVMDRAAGGK